MVREVFIAYPFLLMLIKLWPGDWYNQLETMKMKIDEDNGKYVRIVKGRHRKIRQFSSNEFWKNIGCIISAPILGLGVSRMW